MIKIGNLRTTKDGIRCDRRSRLGNPFHLIEEEYRDRVCEAYQVYFDLVVQGDEPKEAIEQTQEQFPDLKIGHRFKCFSRTDFMAKLNSIPGDATLLCWCAPKRCHCQTIKNHIEKKS